ncbi:MAG: VOC family protein [Coxiellaceae bacterium]|nr:VOC family protein [Coxiellaceae bacterium]
MQQRLSIITLGVSDLERSKKFYQDIGWKLANPEEADNIAAFNLQAMSLVLYPREKLAEDAGVAFVQSGHASVTLAYNVDSEGEVDQVMSDVEEMGASIIKKAEKKFWGGYSGYFADPDGVLWEVAFNPFSKLGLNGEFQWGGVDQLNN